MTEALISNDWQEKLTQYKTLYVGFSGGLDSTVLLHHLVCQPQTMGKLVAIHVNHGLSPNAMNWQMHCQEICDCLGVSLIVRHVEVGQGANLEERAREARYEVFSSLLTQNDLLLLAHHQDDQAETLLLQLCRGAGVDGLAAMADISLLNHGTLARPLLECSREVIHTYACYHQLTWIDDESNQDVSYSRNYLRHHIIPLLQAKWPGVVNHLARSATHCQQAKVNLEALAVLDCSEVAAGNLTLGVSTLQTLSHARLANVLRAWFKNNKVRLPSAQVLNQIIYDLILARDDSSPLVQWGEVSLRRYQEVLYLLKNEHKLPRIGVEWSKFPTPLILGREGESMWYLYASRAKRGLCVALNQSIRVCFRCGGERFHWHGQTKSLKKLFQEWQVPPWQRERVPLLYINGELAAVVGYAVSDHYYVEDDENAFDIELKSCADSRIMD